MATFELAIDPIRPPPGLAGAVYAIGNFDGVHRGHAAVIARTRAIAAARGAPSAVLTFEPHPADYFAGRPVVFRLTPLAIKARLLGALGLSGAVALSFDAALASLSAEEFVDQVLVARLGLAAVVIGWDFHFGRSRSGNPISSLRAGAQRGFAVEIVDKVESDEEGRRELVSSSAIRRALEQGDVEAAARGLGRDYCVEGIVAHGRELGRTLGVPTANLALEPTNRLAHGVYAVRARVGATASRRRRQLRRAPDGRGRRRAAAGGSSLRLFRRPLWPDDGSRLRRPPARGAEIRLARRAEERRWRAT